jgi:hypothetical protein
LKSRYPDDSPEVQAFWSAIRILERAQARALKAWKASHAQDEALRIELDAKRTAEVSATVNAIAGGAKFEMRSQGDCLVIDIDSHTTVYRLLDARTMSPLTSNQSTPAHKSRRRVLI